MFEPFRCEICVHGWYEEGEHYCQYKFDLDTKENKCKEYERDDEEM